jgi:catechol 2,3-dioxygenase-like lactoylglutathione lyase family enzyme
MDAIHHVAIHVTDISEAVAWYRERFTCEVAYQDDSWAMLDFANIKLALVSGGQHPPHIAFERSDAASFGELVSHRDGTASVYVEDSSGNDVEILRPADS